MYYSPTTRNPSGEIILLSFAKETSNPKMHTARSSQSDQETQMVLESDFYFSLVSLSEATLLGALGVVLGLSCPGDWQCEHGWPEGRDRCKKSRQHRVGRGLDMERVVPRGS